MELVRINKFLADSGICSRRKADELIQEGKVEINGSIIAEPGVKIDPENDIVLVEGKKVLSHTKKVYIILNKPCGVISSVKDQFGRKTVMDYVKEVKVRLFHIGRLDYDTSGLILLTNDGEIAEKLMHPRHIVDKVYLAKIKGTPSLDEMKLFEQGLMIEGIKTAPASIEILKNYGSSTDVKITIHEGRNRQIRKMCDCIGHTVLSLKRISIGNISLGNLKEGTYRKLTESEVNYLKGF
jgi:23S rRNA pseudouridine2605 synthase